MTIRVAINGFGRIGRNIFRALYESGKREHIEIIAINDLGNAEINAHLMNFDSVHGQFKHPVTVERTNLRIQNDSIKTYSKKDPAKLE